MKKIIYSILMTGLVVVSSCTNLDVPPKSIATADLLFNDFSSYESFLAKIYAGFSLTGQQGPAGDGDIKGLDEGFSNYLRLYWKAQELPTDEVVVAWNDGTLTDLNTQTWNDGNEFLAALYFRVFYQVSIANEFIRETSDAKLTERGFTDEQKVELLQMRAEARFIRALSYWHGLDLFRNIPFYTEESIIGAEAPSQATGAEVFTFLENELNEIEGILADAGAAPYGRADKGAVWALQSKLFINAEVYTGTQRYSDALIAINKVINSGVYTLEDTYRNNFTADNHLSNEIIFAANFDGMHTRTWGGTTFLIHAAIGGSMDPADWGVDSGWWGLRATSQFVDLFADITGNTDARAIFYTDGQSQDVSDMFDFTKGYPTPKFTNFTSDGVEGSDPTHPDTDFGFFRLADFYLMFAEVALRTGGDVGTGLMYVNNLRERAYGNTSGNVTSIDLDFILDERARELYGEAHRRTDLVRFNQFTENGVWQWKGNDPNGITTAKHLNVYPLPAADLIANPKLIQNEGY